MATMDDLVRQVQELEGATTDLLDATNVSKETLDEAVDSASTDAARAETAESKATPAATKAEAAQGAAEKARDDTEAIAYEGEASLEPKPGSIPIADSEAKLNHGWLPDQSIPHPDFWMPLSSNLKLWEGFGEATFTRSSKATYINKSGVLTEAEENEPRFEKEGILIEGSSTNNLIYSEDINLTNRYSYNAIFTDSSVHSIKGTRFSRDNLENNSYVRFTVGSLESTVTSSLFIKPDFGTSVWLGVIYRNGSHYIHSSRLVDLKTGDDIFRSTLVSENLYRISVTYDSGEGSSSNSSGIEVSIRDDGGVSNTSIFIGGWQIESLPFASSYIPTEGEPVTRNADYLRAGKLGNIPLNPPFTINISCSVIGTQYHYNSVLGIDYGGGFRLDYLENELLRTVYNVNGSQVTQDFGKGFELSNWTIVFSDEQITTYKNGKLHLTLSRRLDDFTMPEGSIRFGSVAGNAMFHGHIKNSRTWHKALTDEQVAALGSAS